MSVITKDLGIATAYGYAKSKGYTGTEEEFAELMASYADVAQQAEAAAQDAEDAKDEAVTAKTDAQTAKTAAQAAQSAAETASGTASAKASEAAQSAQSAAGSASAAQTSATAASGSAQTAQTAAQTATNKASEASSSASAASTAKTGAETARTGAQTAQAAAETAQENAEAAAASVSASAAQIDQNTADIGQIKNDLSELEDDITVSGYFIQEEGFDPQGVIGGYVNSSGEFVTATTGWERTDFIPTAPGAHVSASLKGYLINPIIAYYDANKSYLTSVSVLSNAQLVVNYDGVVPDNVAYAVFVTQTSYETAFYKIGTPAAINDALNIVANDLYGYKDIKIFCLGDSLTTGRDGNGNILAHNYPYYMRESKLKKCTIGNYGVIGSTSKTYWNSHIANVPLDETVDIVICMWGTNGGLVSTSALATDVEPYNDYHDYADTGVGDYCKIIEYILEETQNNAQIILATPPYNGDTSINSRVINAQPVVKQIADRYNLPVIDMFKCGIGRFNYSTYMPVDSVHFSEDGYKWIGTYIGSCVDAVASKRKA